MSHGTYVAPPPTAAELRKQLLERMEQMRERAEEKRRRCIRRSGTFFKSDLKEDSVSGAEAVGEADAAAFIRKGRRLERIDFSDFLERIRHYPSLQQQQLDALFRKLEERPPVSIELKQMMERLTDYINSLLRDERLDKEDVVQQIEGRVDIYLEKAESYGESYAEALLDEFFALSEILGIEMEDETLDRLTLIDIEYRVLQMREQAIQMEHNLRVAETMQDVLESLGLQIEEFSVLDDVIEGELYASPEDPKVKVFISHQNGSFLFEPIVDVDEVNRSPMSIEEAEAEIQKPCQLHARILEEAAKRGMILKLGTEERPTLKSVATTRDLSSRRKVERQTAASESKKERRRRYAEQKAREAE